MARGGWIQIQLLMEWEAGLGKQKASFYFTKAEFHKKKKKNQGARTKISPKTKNQSSKENSAIMHEEKGKVQIKTNQSSN